MIKLREVNITDKDITDFKLACLSEKIISLEEFKTQSIDYIEDKFNEKVSQDNIHSFSTIYLFHIYNKYNNWESIQTERITNILTNDERIIIARLHKNIDISKIIHILTTDESKIAYLEELMKYKITYLLLFSIVKYIGEEVFSKVFNNNYDYIIDTYIKTFEQIEYFNLKYSIIYVFDLLKKEDQIKIFNLLWDSEKENIVKHIIKYLKTNTIVELLTLQGITNAEEYVFNYILNSKDIDINNKYTKEEIVDNAMKYIENKQKLYKFLQKYECIDVQVEDINTEIRRTVTTKFIEKLGIHICSRNCKYFHRYYEDDDYGEHYYVECTLGFNNDYLIDNNNRNDDNKTTLYIAKCKDS